MKRITTHATHSIGRRMSNKGGRRGTSWRIRVTCLEVRRRQGFCRNRRWVLGGGGLRPGTGEGPGARIVVVVDQVVIVMLMEGLFGRKYGAPDRQRSCGRGWPEPIVYHTLRRVHRILISLSVISDYQPKAATIHLTLEEIRYKKCSGDFFLPLHGNEFQFT
jgi:hypothetical protein